MGWMHERACPVAVLDPRTVANTAKLTAFVDMAKFSEAMLVVSLGDTAAETIDCGVCECATSGGAYTALSGEQATQIAAHAANNDIKQIVITVKSEELSSGMRYLKGRIITGNSTGAEQVRQRLEKQRRRRARELGHEQTKIEPPARPAVR